MNKKQTEKTLIGRQEFCDIPEAGLYGIRARIDTGAKTTALHAYNIEVSKEDNGQEHITFTTHPENRRRKDGATLTLPIIDRRHVISSNGQKEERYIVRTTLCLGETCFETDMTLTSRHKMSFPVLIGRNSLIRGKFVVDVAKGYILGKN